MILPSVCVRRGQGTLPVQSAGLLAGAAAGDLSGW